MNDMQEKENIRYFPVASVNELIPGERIFLEVNHEPVVIFQVGDQYYAIGDRCTHDNGPLGDGDLDGYAIICPRHGARFDIRTGKAILLPAVKDTTWYPTRVQAGQIEICISQKED